MSNETVGSLLAVIANSLNDALRILLFADKRAWGDDEFEQLHLLEDTLDEAKKDFQELPLLVNGRFYYENDRNSESLEDLRALCTRFEMHSQTFKEWARAGGPINASWAQDTLALKRDLHRAQCRAARRIYDDAGQATLSMRTRCLGAQQVFRVQQQLASPGGGGGGGFDSATLSRTTSNKTATPSAKDQLGPVQFHYGSLEELAACNAMGKFERFGEQDIAFVCDFCDGYLVWEDLREMPSHPTVPPPLRRRSTTASSPKPTDSDLYSPDSNASSNSNSSSSSSTTDSNTTNWQATGFALSDGAEKSIVFAPVAIANHLPPDPTPAAPVGAGFLSVPGIPEDTQWWQSRLLCPLCDEYYYEEQGEADMERVRYAQDERGFASVAALREHLEWSHAPLLAPSAGGCAVM
ncbi:hypothetical protein F5X96DRAFT_641082 [Biscogniauxia mediterranea]|nr:hypothetical protein F5X96DRAFT_641082 [Biscogniauxia mediterranea]